MMTMLSYGRAAAMPSETGNVANSAAMIDLVRDEMQRDPGPGREQILDGLERLLERAGFENWLIASVPLPLGDVRQHILRSRWPESFMQKYLREDLARLDPLYRAAVGTRSPVRASELKIAAAATPERDAVLDEYASHGLVNSVALPCVRVGHYQVAAVLSGPDTHSDADLGLLGVAFQHMMDRLYDGAPESLHRPSQLTARERQIVALTAEGFTSNEIAGMLTISARTVFAHLTSAGDKLRAANKTETVVNAFRYGQITL